MDEELKLGWEVKMNDVLHERNIDTSSCQVSNDQKVNLLMLEGEQSLFSGALVHYTIDKSGLESGVLAKLMDVLDVMSSCPKDDSLLLRVYKLDQFPHDIEQSTGFFASPYNEEVEL